MNGHSACSTSGRSAPSGTPIRCERRPSQCCRASTSAVARHKQLRHRVRCRSLFGLFGECVPSQPACAVALAMCRRHHLTLARHRSRNPSSTAVLQQPGSDQDGLADDSDGAGHLEDLVHPQPVVQQIILLCIAQAWQLPHGKALVSVCDPGFCLPCRTKLCWWRPAMQRAALHRSSTGTVALWTHIRLKPCATRFARLLEPQ